METYQRNRNRLDKSIQQSENQIEGLNERQRIQDQEIEEARRELANAQSMLGRGLVQNPRVTDARRTLLTSSSISLDTQVEILRTQNQRENLIAELGNLDSDRRSRLVSDLDAARLAIDRTRSKLQAIGQKLVYTNLIRSQLVRGGGGEPSIELRRRNEAGVTQVLPADMDTELYPGDVIEIALHLGSEATMTSIGSD